jgi:hypothetical protein
MPAAKSLENHVSLVGVPCAPLLAYLIEAGLPFARQIGIDGRDTRLAWVGRRAVRVAKELLVGLVGLARLFAENEVPLALVV